MAISTAIQRGGMISVYNETGQQVTIINGGSKPGDRLCGYTPTIVTGKRGGIIYVYDQRAV